MEPAATSFLVTRDPPPPTKTAHPGQGQGMAQQEWARRAFPQILCVLLAFAFPWGLRRAGYDFGLAGPDTYLLAVLCFCLYKLELLRRNPGGDPAEAARERRRIGLAAWAVSLGLGSMVALHVASAAPSLAPRVALWVLAGLAMVLAFYLVFEARRGDSRTDDAGRWPEKDLHELSPELRV
uniref:Uncharacterized protein n=1 Tax=Avena sativa TaxID=4498 RepID=A0ACD5VWM3_AVESA